MEGKTPSRLGQLLIISAIDLLLCCFTMAVMLFLVFQPSQRSDRSSAIAAVGGEGTVFNSEDGSGDAAPAVIIVENRGQNALTANGAASIFTLHKPAGLPGTSRVILTAARSDDLPPLLLQSTRQSGSTDSTIWISVHGTLFERQIKCEGVVSVNIDFQNMAHVQSDCEHPSICPMDRGKLAPWRHNSFISKFDKIDKRSLFVVLYPAGVWYKVQVPQADICTFAFNDEENYSFTGSDLFDQAKRCNIRVNDDPVIVMEGDQVDCLLQAVPKRDGIVFLSSCEDFLDIYSVDSDASAVLAMTVTSNDTEKRCGPPVLRVEQ